LYWFFIGYWILKRGWIFILALFYFPLIKPENSHFLPLFPLLEASFSHLEINSLIMNT